MALYLALNPDGTGVVSEANPIQTKHSSEGEAITVPVYLFNDGKRKNVENDTNPPALIYTNIQIKVEGVAYTLAQPLTGSISDVTVTCDSVSGWNLGTIIKSGLERMRIEELLTANSCRVTRNYSADGKASSLSAHSTLAVFTAETTSVSLALPNPSDVTYDTAGTFLSGGVSITTGLDPSFLSQAVNNLEATNIIKSNNALKYANNSLIKIDNEIMKVVAVVGTDIQVLRGYGTAREAHSQNAIIYCVGIVDLTPVTHKFFIKNDPPAGLPTQKKKDIKIVIVADEEPL